MADEWQVPRCSHSNIILGCPDPDCPEQNAYVDEQVAQIHAYYDRQAEEALQLILSLAGRRLLLEEPEPRP